ncbi:7969_t:CDS:2, partial [Diversispora eburnea]
MSTRGIWSLAIAYFDDPNILEQILSEWSQTVEEESCRVSISTREYMIKIVDIKTKTYHRCYAEEHLVLNCPITKRQKEINERKTKDFEKYGYMYKTTRSCLYQNLRNQVGMRIEYSDAVKRNVITIRRNTGLISNQEDSFQNIINMLETIKQDIVEIKKQTKNIDKKVQYLEEYAGYNLEEKIYHMRTQMEQKANTVKMLVELIPELKKSNDETQERL